jgi:tRNA threonylcarbamoyladenosine biosynthesis protein TsaB
MAPRHQRRLLGNDGPDGPLVVGFETGGEHLGVALLRVSPNPKQSDASWRILESANSHLGHRHAQTLLSMLNTMLERQGLTPEDIALIGVGKGPGGFTGVRIGMATAVGLAMGTGAVVWPVCSLAVLAHHAVGTGAGVVPMVDARKGEVYAAAFDARQGQRLRLVVEPRVGSHERLLADFRDALGDESPVVFGSGALVYDVSTVVPPQWHVSSAVTTAWLAAGAWNAAERDADAAPDVDPSYVRASDAELSLE